jgi:diaminohydroxyphosphoribosylaminopyrimidine deaminase/5-amino-6-(5-phosphoribosylamino)uracil reductase
MTTSAADARFMARALQLARRGMYTTDPNPRVGCVIVKDGKILGEGWHERAGQPHAEINALNQAGTMHAHSAGVYLTLEPCCHQGRTPPCTQALIKAGVKRVVAAMRDPNPLVAGKGVRELESHGIRVDVGLMESEAAALNPGFVSRMRHERPYVRVKLAASLDGRTAMADGESKWITGEAARADVQKWRARSSAILTGVSTVLADDPALNVRGMDIARGAGQPTANAADGAPAARRRQDAGRDRLGGRQADGGTQAGRRRGRVRAHGTENGGPGGADAASGLARSE